MKLLIIVDGLRSGGKERRLVELLKGLDKRNDFNITLLVLSSNVHFSEIHNLNINLTLLSKSPGMDFTVFHKLYKIVETFKPKVILSWDSMSSFYAGPVAKFI